MKILIILNDPPYGTERSYNRLRLAKSLAAEKAEVTLFLLSDAVSCARQEQQVPEGFYNIELMLKSVLRNGKVLLCGACLNARGIRDEDPVQGVERIIMQALAEQTLAADKVLVL
ncbi:MAG TPA: hypothetical protein ENG92_02170 [Thiolapillus brandeum]|uniref:Sulfur reduction protein DsrE n=1 Tax=Thiolapillus brandeum TaxID=1076588 RepID=A0A831NRZ8_9GAMM|nr:hypothetical protein [Thiolapillus brandeum]